jgi:hypothetical protein
MRKFAILILAMEMIAGVAGAAADDGPKPPAPNLFPPKAGCPPNMLGVWQMIYEGYQDIYGDVTITPDAIEFGKIGRFKLSPAGPLLDGIDWSQEPLALPVQPEDIDPKRPQEILLLDPPLTVPGDHVEDFEVISIEYGQDYSQTECEMQIVICKTKRDNALAFGGQQAFSKCTVLWLLARPPNS